VDLSVQGHPQDGGLDDHGQVVLGTGENEIIHASSGNDVLVGGGGADTFVWDNHTMGQNSLASDIIKDFQYDHNSLGTSDALRFEDLFSGNQSSLDALLNVETNGNNISWNNMEFHAVSSDGNTAIHLSVTDAAATLTVSYEDTAGIHMQNVQLQNFSVADHVSLTGDSGHDEAAIAQMLHEIIKVGGNT